MARESATTYTTERDPREINVVERLYEVNNKPYIVRQEDEDQYNEEISYKIDRDDREINAVERLQKLRGVTYTPVEDEDIQEHELKRAIRSAGYLDANIIGTPGGVVPLNDDGQIDSAYLPTTTTGIAALSLAGTTAQVLNRTAIIPTTTETCAGLLSCEDKAKLDSIDLNTLATTEDLSSKQDTIADLATIRSGAALGATAIQSHQDISGKLNKLPLIDNTSDPGYGQPYHIPYNFTFTPTANNATVTLHTLTLDNNVTKTDVSKDIPVATTSAAGLMSSGDKQILSNIAPSKLEESLTVVNAVGGVTAGTVFPAGTSLLTILSQILSGSTPPGPTTTEYIYYAITNNSPSISSFDNPDTTEQVSKTALGEPQSMYTHSFNNGESDDPQYLSFAYPSRLGDLTSIIDSINADELHLFTKITDNTYNIYYRADQWVDSDYTLKFNF